jgi:hypothetical protein
VSGYVRRSMVTYVLKLEIHKRLSLLRIDTCYLDTGFIERSQRNTETLAFDVLAIIAEIES